jgi:hypothetical protein
MGCDTPAEAIQLFAPLSEAKGVVMLQLAMLSSQGSSRSRNNAEECQLELAKVCACLRLSDTDILSVHV